MCSFVAYLIVTFIVYSLCQDFFEIMTLEAMETSVCAQTAYCAPFMSFVEMVKGRSLFSTIMRFQELF